MTNNSVDDIVSAIHSKCPNTFVLKKEIVMRSVTDVFA